MFKAKRTWNGLCSPALSAGVAACLLLVHPVAGLSAEDQASLRVMDWKACVKEAALANARLMSAWQSIKQAEADRAGAGSGRRLQVSGSASAGRGKSAGSDAAESYSYGASASQLLYDGGKSGAGVGRADDLLAASRYAYQASSADVRLSLRNAFIGLLRAQEMAGISENIRKRREQSTRLVGLRYEAGREHKGSVLTAEAKLAQAQLEVAQAKRAVELTQRKLAEQIGWTKTGQLMVVGKFDVGVVEKTRPDFGSLLEDTPDIKELVARTESVRKGVTIAEAGFAPTLKADAGISKSAQDWPPDDEKWSVGVGLSLPVLEGGRRLAELSGAKAALTRAVADSDYLRNSASTDLLARWIELQNAMDGVEVKKKFFDAAVERANIANAQYSTGLLAFDNWIIIEDEHDRAEKDLLEAKAAALAAEAYWVRAKGGTLDNETN